MAELIPMPLTTVQKIRLLARQYEGVLVLQVCHFGLSCKLTTKGFTIAFPLLWETIESETYSSLCDMIALMALDNLNEKPRHA
jgi:hypothetical protein